MPDKIVVSQRGEDATIVLPAMPEGMESDHYLVFKKGDDVLFGLGVMFTKEYAQVDVFDPDGTEPISSALVAA